MITTVGDYPQVIFDQYFRVPSDMLYSNPESEKLFLQEYDKFGDSFYDDTDVEKLKTIFSKIEDEVTFQ